MHGLVPSRLALDWVTSSASEPWRTLDGTWLLVDVSGFTRLTERLTVRGDEGAEYLHSALTRTFAALVEPALAHGGDVIGFAGDAALVRFDGPDHELRSVHAATAMARGLDLVRSPEIGRIRLRVSMGIHTANAVAVLTRSHVAQQRGLFVIGPEISRLVRLQAAATSGEIAISGPTAAALPSAWVGGACGEGVTLVRRHVRPDRTASQVDGDVTRLEPPTGPTVRTLLAPALAELADVEQVRHEHRSVSVGFVAVPGVDELLRDGGPELVHATLSAVAASIADAGAATAVSWLDTDVGDGEAKFLIAAGAPRAVDDDGGRLLSVLRQVIHRSELPLRAGAQRGRVFAGPLGAGGRAGYTLLGDAVNVAARALASAGPRELIVGDGFDISTRPSVEAVALGSRRMRNRRVPMPLWRVERADAPERNDWSSQQELVIEARSRASHRLTEAWEATRRGRGSVIALVGPPGAGSSTLARHLVSLVGPASAMVVADRFRRHVPYAALDLVVRALASRAASSGGAHRTDVDPDAAWASLAGHVDVIDPELRPWCAAAVAIARGVRPADDTDPRSVRERTRAVLTALLAAALPRPGLLVVDGADDIDHASASVIRELSVVASEGTSMLFLSSQSPSDLPVHEVAEFEVIELDDLDETTATDLVERAAPRLRDDEVADIVRVAGGNPFVLCELARHRRSGPLPTSLAELGAVLLDDLDPAVRGLVRDVSVLGQAWSHEMAAEILERPELTDPAVWVSTAPILRHDGTGQMSFRHDVYRQVAYDTLTFSRRRALHGALADLLARRPGRTTDDADAGSTVPASIAAERAAHLHAAGRWSEAFPLAVEAGLSAKAGGTLVEASDLLGRALDMGRRSTDVATSDEMGVVAAELGDVAMWTGDLDGAERAYRLAWRRVTDGEQRARLCHRFADLSMARGRLERATTWIRRGLAALDRLDGGAHDLRVHLLLDRSAVAFYRGRHRSAVRLALEALDLARHAGSPQHEGLAHLHLEMAYSALMLPEAVEHGDAAVALFQAIGHDRYLESALHNTALTATYLGEWDRSVERYERALAMAMRRRQYAEVAHNHLNIGFLRQHQGRLAEAEALGRRALRTFDAMGADGPAGYAKVLLAMVAIDRAGLDDAASAIGDARSVFERIGDVAMVADCDTLTLAVLARRRRWTEVVVAAEPLRKLLHSAEVPVRITYERLLGQAEAMLGHEPGASRVLEALAAARRHGLVYEEYRSLGTLIEIEDGGGPPAPPEARRQWGDLAARLGIVDRDEPTTQSAATLGSVGFS